VDKWSNLAGGVTELSMVLRVEFIQVNRVEEDSSADFC